MLSRSDPEWTSMMPRSSSRKASSSNRPPAVLLFVLVLVGRHPGLGRFGEGISRDASQQTLLDQLVERGRIGALVAVVLVDHVAHGAQIGLERRLVGAARQIAQRRQRDGRQDADHRDDDDELEQREAKRVMSITLLASMILAPRTALCVTTSHRECRSTRPDRRANGRRRRPLRPKSRRRSRPCSCAGPTPPRW